MPSQADLRALFNLIEQAYLAVGTDPIPSGGVESCREFEGRTGMARCLWRKGSTLQPIRLVVRGYVDGISLSLPHAQRKPLLKILYWPGLRQAHPNPILIKICSEAQKAVNRQAKALLVSRWPGRHTAEVVQECTLDLVGLKRGSTTLDFVPASEQLSLCLSVWKLSAASERRSICH